MPSPVLYGGQEMFDWNRAWYPIAPLEYLNADAPNAVKLLGKRMVLWCSNQDSWIVDPKLRMGRNEWLGEPKHFKSRFNIDYPIFWGTEFWPISSYDSFFAWLIGKVVKAGSYTGLLRVVSHMKGTPINQLVWDVWSLIMFNWPWVKWSKQPRGRYQWLDQIGGVLEIYK